MTLTVGSLFSGIGGMDLGLERAGMAVLWQSEIDAYASQVLARHWPGVPNLGDITTIDWNDVERPDLICGGYPCQPFSLAGNRAGTGDPRHLWPHMLDAVRSLRPRFVLIENVAAHLGLGFDRVLCDLAALGFDAEWSVVSACSVGAPHMRRRLFCVAHADGAGRRAQSTDEARGWDLPSGWLRAPHAHGQGLAGERTWNQGRPGSLGMVDGLPGWVDRRRVAGNAVVPAVAELIARRIVAADASERAA